MTDQQPSTAIVVHGGAGRWEIGSRRLAEAVEACREAASGGAVILDRGGRALDAVEAAVRVLEDCPVLNAGRGSHPTSDGIVEMDALVMEGRDLGLGAIAAVRGIPNPVSLARLVMERTAHTLVVGEGAERLAREFGVRTCSNDELIPGREVESSDTVGAVARDRHGDLAVGSSTGGIRRQIPGRVGDTPLAGCGAYADNGSAAVAATGDGEALMKVTIARRVCELVESGETVQAACEAALRVLGERFRAAAGLIGVDAAGAIAIAFNSPAMPHAAFIDGQQVRAGYEQA